MAFPVDWGSKHKITIDNTKVSGSANLTDFPVLLTEDNFLTDAFDNSDNGGGDIRFSSDLAGDTQLSCEIVSWVTGTDEAEVWVKIPTLSYDADTDIYVWYNKTGETQPAIDATYGAESVWNSGYVMVQHFNGNGTDSTSNDNDVTTNSGVVYTATGKIGKGASFDANDYLIVADKASLDLTSGVTLEGWASPDDVSSNHQIVFCKDEQFAGTPTNTYGLMIGSNTQVYGGVGSGSADDQTSKAGLVDTEFQYLSWAWNTTDYYVGRNSAFSSTGSSGVAAIQTNANDVYIGKDNGVNVYPFAGVYDELRISNIQRTQGWLVTSYNNQNAPDTFASAISTFVPRVMVVI